jgi:hypothetical protein
MLIPMTLTLILMQQPAPSGWRLVEDLRIGEADGPGALTAVSALVTSRDESLVFVGQPQEQTIRVFDAATGSFLSNVGRSGQGPGEFRSISRLSVRGDTMFVADLFQQRLVWFSISGDHIQTAAIRSRSQPSVSAVVPAPEGLFWGESPFRPGLRGPMERPLVLMDVEGRTEAVVAVQSMAGGSGAVVAGDRVAVFMQPFATLRHLRAFAPDGSAVVVVDTENGGGRRDGTYLVLKITPRADTVFSARLIHRPTRLPQQVRDSIYASFSTIFGGSRRGMRLAREHVDVPEIAPPVADVVVDVRGRTWVRRAFPDAGEPNLLILDRNGVVVAVAQIPDRVRMLHVSTRHVWGVEADELGVPFVVRYLIQAEGGRPPASPSAGSGRGARYLNRASPGRTASEYRSSYSRVVGETST